MDGYSLLVSKSSALRCFAVTNTSKKSCLLLAETIDEARCLAKHNNFLYHEKNGTCRDVTSTLDGYSVRQKVLIRRAMTLGCRGVVDVDDEFCGVGPWGKPIWYSDLSPGRGGTNKVEITVRRPLRLHKVSGDDQ